VQKLGAKWQNILTRNVSWKMACERTINFHSSMAAQTTIFGEPELMERRLRDKLPVELREIPLKIDVAKHYHRPSARLPVGGQNFLLDPSQDEPIELNDDDLFRSLPVSFLIFRVYAQDHTKDAEINAALNSVLGASADTKTNM
jgi:hypothetical protein